MSSWILVIMLIGASGDSGMAMSTINLGKVTKEHCEIAARQWQDLMIGVPRMAACIDVGPLP